MIGKIINWLLIMLFHLLISHLSIHIFTLHTSHFHFVINTLCVKHSVMQSFSVSLILIKMAKSTAVKDGRKRGNQLFEKVMLKKEKMQNHVKEVKMAV